MKMAYLAVVAHQPYAEMKRLTMWELDAFFDHVVLEVERQNENMERDMEEARVKGVDG
jgi:hypothetical protein